ncbi:MAG TPA: HD domain-containing protein [Solirubrobacteraceae bacterium]|nr:HD domain-containing protein [Solirubrobacteraceae bacterium]
MFVRDLIDGHEVDQPLLVRAAEVRTKRDGGEYLKLSLGDRTGQLTAMVWDGVAALKDVCRAGCVVHVTGRHEVHPRWGAQLAVRALRAAEPGTFSLADLLDGPPVSAERMEQDLRALVATVQDPHLRALLDRVLGEGTRTWELYRRAPAAKVFHQAYAHGLLEHSLTVAQGVSAMASTFPGIDRDVAVTGALLHDIGKLEAYTTDPQAIDMTDAGKLLGEIPLGYYRIRRTIEELPGFPPQTAQAVLHIILSHHGSLEHGSPVVPCTREATLVHFIDNLGGRLGSFDRLEKELAPGASWSPFDRVLGAGAYFGPAAEPERQAA